MAELALAKKPDEVAAVEVQKKEALTSLEAARALVVTDAAGYTAAREFINEIARRDKKAEEFFAPLKQAAHEAHRRICEAEKAVRGPFQQARDIVEPKAIAWHDEQERKKREAEAKLEAERKKREEDDRLALAEAMEADGDSEGAAAVLDEPIQAAPVDLPKADFIPQVAGGGPRTNYTHRVVNLKQLVEAVAIPIVIPTIRAELQKLKLPQSERAAITAILDTLTLAQQCAPLNAIKADDVFLGQQARAFKKEGMLYPGVTVYADKGFAASRK